MQNSQNSLHLVLYGAAHLTFAELTSLFALTVYNHRNAEKAGDAGAHQAEAAGPAASHRSPIHHQYRDDVGRHLERSRQKGVEIDVAMQ